MTAMSDDDEVSLGQNSMFENLLRRVTHDHLDMRLDAVPVPASRQLQCCPRHRPSEPAIAPAHLTPVPAAPMLSKVIEEFLLKYPKSKRQMYKKQQAVLPLFLSVVRDKPVSAVGRLT